MAMRRPVRALAAATLLALAAGAWAADWPQWGGRDERNFASDEKGIPTTFAPAVAENKDKGVAAAPARHLKWVARLGSQTYGNPTVSGGRVFVGTNDASFKDRRLHKSGGGLVLCLDEATGQAHWKHELGAHVWGSTFAVDGKVFVGDEAGKVTVFACDRQERVLGEMKFDVPVYYATPIAAGGVLYVTTQTHLYAARADAP